MKKALFVLDDIERIYAPRVQREIAELVDLFAPPQGPDVATRNPDVLGDAEIILSGWGAPTLDERFLATAPKLEAVFYGAGSIRHVVTSAFWERDITMCTAWAANAIPVSEYALSQILFCLKHGYRVAQAYRKLRSVGEAWKEAGAMPGVYGSTVGIISLGMIGRLVTERLRPFDVHILAYDPFATQDDAAELGVELVSLDALFARADVVSLHTPWLPETEGMITGQHFRAMKSGATFINTARGAVVREDELIEVLRTRPDLFAVLDVTYPEPPRIDSPLWDLPNVVLTPHMAGSMDAECHRMGAYMLDELRRYLTGQPLKWRVTETKFQTMA